MTKPESGVDRPQYRAPALERGLDILELLADEPHGIGQAEIAAKLGKSVSQVFRMLHCLQRRGYVAMHKPADVYTLTLKMFELSHRHPPMKRLIQEALPLMNEVASATDQSCHLSIIHDDRMLVVAQVDSPGSIGFSVRIGAALDPLETASGLTMLAYQPAAERERLASLRPAGGAPATSFKSIEARCAAIRQRGYEESDSRQIHGVRNISAPIIGFSGEAIAALAIPFIRRVDRQTVSVAAARDVLLGAAQKLSRAIGADAINARTSP
ncbi:MAG: IclR family transcriptional regulator [Hyphomonadaceae bacterium]|nr:IclR family transcriptional regulator [Hyphomonadaceae bacterium]